jgi:hypothetical protein
MKLAPFILSLCMSLSVFAQSPCATAGPVPIQDHGKWGYLSEDGVVVPAHFDYAGPFTGDGAIASVANECGLVGSERFIHNPDLESSEFSICSGVFRETWSSDQGRQVGYLDRERKVVIPFQFKYTGRFDHGMARVVLKNKAFFIDKTGARVTPEFDGAFDFHEDLAAVEVGKNIGYIRRDGSLALPPVHQSASGIDFSEGLAAVRINGKVGIHGQDGKHRNPAYVR